MDVDVIPSSNPYAWLRLTDDGLRLVLEANLTEDSESAEAWIERTILATRQGQYIRYTTSCVETITDGLDDKYYRQDVELRSVKRDLGLRRAAANRIEVVDKAPRPRRDRTAAVRASSAFPAIQLIQCFAQLPDRSRST